MSAAFAVNCRRNRQAQSSRRYVCPASCVIIRRQAFSAAGKDINGLDKTSEKASILFRLTTIGLAVPALLLVVVSLFAIQEMLLILAAPAIARSAADTVRGSYALVTLRNLWLIFGGMLALGLIIYSLDRLFKHADKMRTRRYFLRLLAVELVIIGLQFVIAG